MNTCEYCKEIYNSTPSSPRRKYKYCLRCGNSLEWGKDDILDKTYWTSRDGTIHQFKDMSDEHLANAIELLKRDYSVEDLKDTNLFKGLSIEFCSRDILRKYIQAYKFMIFDN